VGAPEKSPRESDLDHESSSLLIRRLKNNIGFSLQRFHTQSETEEPSQKSKTR
jgi:hypothetical protein